MSINLTEPPINLFSDIAESKANEIAKDGAGQEKNKPTQLRGFYDEILNWEQRSRQLSDTDFAAQLPLIHMIIAKVAYAKERKHVTEKYQQLMRECISSVKTRKELRNCKLFFEAFMGFYKGAYEQQKKEADDAKKAANTANYRR